MYRYDLDYEWTPFSDEPEKYYYMAYSKDGEYVRWDDLVNLLEELKSTAKGLNTVDQEGAYEIGKQLTTLIDKALKHED